MQYYKNQLDQLQDSEYFKTIQIVDGNGNKTKCMDLNLESLPILIEYLLSEQNKLYTLKMETLINNIIEANKGV